MTDQDRFERRLRERLVAHAQVAGNHVDASRLAHAAMSAPPHGAWGLSLPRVVLPRPAMVLILLGLLLAAIVGAVAITGAPGLREDRVPLAEHEPGTFVDTGSMARARYWQTAVRLADGGVLLTGGFASPDEAEPNIPPEILPTEIYDPATDSFRQSPALLPVHQGSSATLLADGRVLIVGGRVSTRWPDEICGDDTCALDGVAIADAVVFDPDTGTMTPVSPMRERRWGHAATLLPDGRVLVAGGWTGSPTEMDTPRPGPQALASAELFDPRTGAFEPTGPMSEAVAPDMSWSRGIAVTLLPTGQVLIGRDLFDPATARFHRVTAADRIPGDPRIVYLGEQDQLRVFDAQALATTGDSPGVPFDGRVEHLLGRFFVATQLADGRVLWTGAPSSDPSALDAVLADPTADGVAVTTPIGPLGQRRFWHTATELLDGRVLIAGGWHFPGAVASAELFRPPPMDLP